MQQVSNILHLEEGRGWFAVAVTHTCMSTLQPTDCPGIDGFLNGENIANYEGCSRVMGNIVINEGSFQR